MLLSLVPDGRIRFSFKSAPGFFGLRYCPTGYWCPDFWDISVLDQ